MYAIQEIQEVIQATTPRLAFVEASIEHLLLDSRQIIFAERSLFFAIKGAHQDGHLFLPTVYAAGVRNFVVTHLPDLTFYPEANFLQVQNAIQALQRLAAHHRRQFPLQVIGITGSNGKTIVKEWLFQLLYSSFAIIRSPRSYNSQIGVPLSVWGIQAQHELGIFEAGISRSGEMAKLVPILQPQIGIFTMLGEAHSEGFESLEAKLQEKLSLFAGVNTLIYRRDDPRVHRAIEALGCPTTTWSLGLHADADLYVFKTETFLSHTHLEGRYQGQEMRITLPFTDQASTENAIHCWATLLHLGLQSTQIMERMAQLEPVAMRMELLDGQNNCLIINDTYNADLSSLRLGLQWMRQHDHGRNRSLILTEILQSGVRNSDLYPQIAQLIQQHQVNRVIGVGEATKTLQECLPAETEQAYFENTESLLENLPALHFQSEVILLKGARQFQLEKIAQALSRQVHQARLEVNLSALAHNLRAYQRCLQPGVKTMVMIKATAYGAGSKEVARLLEYLRVDYCCVAYADEGTELRQAGISAPIMVLNPELGAFEQMRLHRLEPVVYSLEQLKNLNPQALPHGIHLSIDSGMHRLGFDAHELDGLLNYLLTHPGLTVKSIYTHLAASEDPAHDAFTHEQARRFNQAYAQITEVLGYKPLQHALNSNGITRFPQYQQDMVRLGIGLYGIDVSNSLPEPLQVVLSFKATISQVKTVAEGESIGYGRRARAHSLMRTGTISVGYADGLRRGAGNGDFSVGVRGKRAPILGSVCMDMSMIDLTHIPEAQAGDTVEIFGQNPSVDELARILDTIPYEVFTGISQRVKRVYLQE
jgi:alanine racemase